VHAPQQWFTADRLQTFRTSFSKHATSVPTRVGNNIVMVRSLWTYTLTAESSFWSTQAASTLTRRPNIVGRLSHLPTLAQDDCARLRVEPSLSDSGAHQLHRQSLQCSWSSSLELSANEPHKAVPTYAKDFYLRFRYPWIYLLTYVLPYLTPRIVAFGMHPVFKCGAWSSACMHA